MKKLFQQMMCVFAAFLVADPARAQVPTPAPPQSQPVLIRGATIHTVSGKTIENAELLFDEGRISAIGRVEELPENTLMIEAPGRHVYPAMFEACSQLGLAEISSVPAMSDFRETGSLNPNVTAAVAVNPESDVIAVTRANGVLVAVTAPSGGLVSGVASIIQLDGWTHEEMTVEANAAMVVNWPGDSRGRRRRPTSEDEPNQAGDATKELDRLFDDARAYAELRTAADSKQAFDPRLEAMAKVIQGGMPLYVRADALADIEAAVAFSVRQHCKLIILGGYDAPHCAELLKKHSVPVVVSAVYRMPRRANEPDDHAYTLPARLKAAGVKFCISSVDRSETWNARNLPYHAATAQGFGLSPEDALKAVTLYPAQIFGVDDRLGAIDVGKEATFIVTDGDPLDTRTQVLAAFVQGRPVDLSNRQSRLNDKYREKYRQQGHIPQPKDQD